MVLILLAQNDKSKTLTSIISESMPHLKRGAIRDFKNIMQVHKGWKDKEWNATDMIYTFGNGSQIEFFSADQADKLRGGRRERCFINEANNITLDAFDQLEVRTRDFIFLDWNPTSEFWFYTDVKPSREDLEHIVLNYKDNEACPKEIIQSIESRKDRKNWYKIYGLGELGELEGRIYNNWRIIDEIPHEARLERYGLDFGYTNDPTAIMAVYYHNNGWILDEKVYQKGMSNKEIADTLKVMEPRLIVADSAEPKSIDEISSYGVNIQPCAKGKDSVRTGIQLIQDQPISITKKSINAIKEYRNYLWRTDREGKLISPNEPEKINDHCMDATRYAMEDLGRIKQEKSYWDRIYEKELEGTQKVKFNKER